MVEYLFSTVIVNLFFFFCVDSAHSGYTYMCPDFSTRLQSLTSWEVNYVDLGILISWQKVLHEILLNKHLTQDNNGDGNLKKIIKRHVSFLTCSYYCQIF